MIVAMGAQPARSRHLVMANRWLFGPLLTVLVSSFVIFAALSGAPGDPAVRLLGGHPTEIALTAERHRLGLDRSVLVRYWDWLTGAAHGDFGTSITYRTDVAGLLEPRIVTTLLLTLMAGLLIVVFGIGIGIVGAVFRPAGTGVTSLTSVGIAVPAYVAALVLVNVFALKLGWFPAIGGGQGLADRIWHLTLPAISLAIGYAAYVGQVTHSALRDELGAEHVQSARGRGIPAWSTFRRHVLRNAAAPIITVSGLSLAALVAGAVVVESAFGIDGIGSFLVTSVSAKDYNVVLAISLLLVVVFVVVNTLVDAVNTVLDPRARTMQDRP
jgi:peptide/nickel transport system permease protein